MHTETLIFLSINNLLQILVHNDFTPIPDYARSACHKSIYCNLLLTLLFRRDTIAMLGPLLTFPITTPSFLSMGQYFNWLRDWKQNEHQVRITTKMNYRACKSRALHVACDACVYCSNTPTAFGCKTLTKLASCTLFPPSSIRLFFRFKKRKYTSVLL